MYQEQDIQDNVKMSRMPGKMQVLHLNQNRIHDVKQLSIHGKTHSNISLQESETNQNVDDNRMNMHAQQ